MLAKEKLDRSLRYGVVDTSSSLEKYQYLPAVSQPLPPITTSKIQVNSFFIGTFVQMDNCLLMLESQSRRS